MQQAYNAKHVNKEPCHAELELEIYKRKKINKERKDFEKNKLRKFFEHWKAVKGEEILFEKLDDKSQRYLKNFVDGFKSEDLLKRAVETEKAANLEELLARDQFFSNLTFKTPKAMLNKK